MILKEIEHLVAISRNFQEIYLGKVFNEHRVLRKCYCTDTETCNRCEGLGIFIEKGILHKISPLSINIDIRFKYPINYSSFNTMYSLYLLYKNFMPLMKTFDHVIIVCPTCKGMGEITNPTFKDRLPQIQSCPTCNGSVFIVGKIEQNIKHNTEHHLQRPPFYNG
jgi:hypothetical protein